MAIGQWAVVLGQVRRAFGGATVVGLSEGELLARFLDSGDESAFEALLARHGPMVLGVCRSVLRDPRDVEDAFQATFLVLVRRGPSLGDRDVLAPWLFGVARKVARRARADAWRRRSREIQSEAPPPALVDPEDFDLRERRRLVRDEVARLPDRERSVVVLCDLEGLSHAEAASRLGWPLGTVKGRLSRARERLARRLVRRGLAPSALAVAAADLARDASAALPASLIRSTAVAATRLAAGKPLAAGIVSAHALALTEGVLRTMFLAAPWKAAALLVAAGCTVAAPALMAGQDPPSAPAQPASSAPSVPPGPGLGTKPVDAPKLEEGPAPSAVEQLAGQALRDLEARRASSDKPIAIGEYIRWSRRLAEAQGAFDPAKPDQAARAGHLARMRKLDQYAQNLHATGQSPRSDVLEVTYQILEAEAAPAPSKPAPTAPQLQAAPAPAPILAPVPLSEPVRPVKAASKPSERSLAIFSKLRESFAIRFPRETPLREVLAAITRSTRDPALGLPDGIEFYVEPFGSRTQVSIDVAEIPLKTALDLIVKQFNGAYVVKDGLVMIFNQGGVPVQDDAEPQRIEPAQAGVGSEHSGPAPGGSASDVRTTSYRTAKIQNPADEERNKAVRTWLDRTIPFRFGGEEGTPLGAAIREIKKLSQDAGAKPIPIYVDRLGLQDAEKTIESTVSIDLEGVPLRTSLRLMLAQIGLTYLIDGGMLVITAGEPIALADIDEVSPYVREQTAAILPRLETIVPIRFPKETPLADALKAIQAEARGPAGPPIPIYVDPLGLQRGDKTMASPVVMEVEGLPLRTTLRALLAQLGLRYEVTAGVLLIDYDDTEDKEDEARKKRENDAGRGGMGGGFGGGFRSVGGMM